DCYYVEGVLRLPYAEINEPFYGWFESKRSRSRVDYYGAYSVQTYQLGGETSGDYGVNLKVAPMTTEELLNVKQCFQLNGTEASPVEPQSLLPNLEGFKNVGEEIMYGIKCTVWRNVTRESGKKNTYTFYQNSETSAPVRYEMTGYDTLLISHYDRYYIDYVHFTARKSFPDRIFTIKNNLTCSGFPGPGFSGGQHHHVTMNPIREFIHNDVGYVDQEFKDFRKRHGKNYGGEAGEEDKVLERKKNFHQNFRFVQSQNRKNLGYTMKLNHLADYSDDELRLLMGKKVNNNDKLTFKRNGGLSFNESNFSDVSPPPDHWDWRFLGAVTPVKDQAVCGSCWSFGTTGCLEGAHFLKTKELVRLSQQELIDCSWGEGSNNGCDGGEDFRAYQWVMKHGLASEEDYGTYMGQDGYCKMKTVPPTAAMLNYVTVTPGNATALKQAMVRYGPISVGIDAAHKSFVFYSSGVYYEPACGNTLESIDHAVLAVGYGTLNGEDYWLIKNSWSTYWGNDGYVLISQKDNNCGVTTSATYVLM
ncbi:hypothetical protein HELRODRAFT_88556, partial [Helobdella robusta]|uniref:Peptidase C1A papain C-terminal domain-containing protein n=1 Tax=Helobdella robusta TaxID=6412 RepID=T1G738_HELRO